ncbi:MAG: heme NO-binding domain-containing protein [Fluviicola sp.]|jgi:hypothetical protein
MKGIVFTEFSEMVENQFGLEYWDELITSCNLPSNGVYTSIGTYDHSELVQLVVNLSKQKNIPLNELLESFGLYLFNRFTILYPSFFADVDSLLDFLESVEDYIHVEVFKLYPDAELPKFSCQRLDSHTLIMLYQSDKAMANLAVGLITGAMEFYKEKGTILLEPLNESGTKVQISIRLEHG